MADDSGHRRRAAQLLFLSAGEASERQTVVVGGVVHPLAVKASGGGIPATGGVTCTSKGRSGQRWWHP